MTQVLARCTAPLVLLVLIATERPAQACTCDGWPVMLSPFDGATGVPRNVRLAVYLPYVPVAQGDPVITLREAGGGAEVPLVVQSTPQGGGFGRILFADPDGPVAGGVEYEITVPAHGATGLTATFTFTTDDSLDHAPPTFAGLAGLEAYRYRELTACNNSCTSGAFSRLELAYDGPGVDTAFLLLEVRRQAEEAPSHVVPFVWGPRVHVDATGCSPTIPQLEPGQSYCARLLAYDAAGNIAGADAEVCAVAASCAYVPDEQCIPERGCRRTGGCAATPGLRAPGPGMALILLTGLLLLAAGARRRVRRW